MSEMVQELWGAIAFGAIAYIILWMAKRKGFFRFPYPETTTVPLTLIHILAAFAIYFGVSLFISPVVISLLRSIAYQAPSQINAVALSSWANLILSSLIALLLTIYWKNCSSKIAHEIWRRENHGSYTQDLAMGGLAWVLSFPIVLSVSQLLDVLVYAIFNVTQLPDQVAVLFLKMTFAHPLYFILAVISIVGLAPFIEELIFRGFLQTYARKFVSPKIAILISSTCFSFFHYTPEQGLGNIPIIGSLFVLALFLGFLYERQRSLFASITLHACFNAISVFNLYALGGAPRGAL